MHSRTLSRPRLRWRDRIGVSSDCLMVWAKSGSCSDPTEGEEQSALKQITERRQRGMPFQKLCPVFEQSFYRLELWRARTWRGSDEASQMMGLNEYVDFEVDSFKRGSLFDGERSTGQPQPKALSPDGSAPIEQGKRRGSVGLGHAHLDAQQGLS